MVPDPPEFDELPDEEVDEEEVDDEELEELLLPPLSAFAAFL